MKEKLIKKELVKEVKSYLVNEQEKQRQQMLWGMCITDHKGNVMKIEDITDKEWEDFMTNKKHIIQTLKTKYETTN